MKAAREGRPVTEGCETLGDDDGRVEEIMLGLRTRKGVSRHLLAVDRQRLVQLEGLGLLKTGEGRVSLTARGMLLSNTLICEFLPA
jgi:coproporphyrinogen III oxidase-like Fe-S oxidoreductase